MTKNILKGKKTYLGKFESPIEVTNMIEHILNSVRLYNSQNDRVRAGHTRVVDTNSNNKIEMPEQGELYNS